MCITHARHTPRTNTDTTPHAQVAVHTNLSYISIIFVIGYYLIELIQMRLLGAYYFCQTENWHDFLTSCSAILSALYFLNWKAEWQEHVEHVRLTAGQRDAAGVGLDPTFDDVYMIGTELSRFSRHFAPLYVVHQVLLFIRIIQMAARQWVSWQVPGQTIALAFTKMVACLPSAPASVPTGSLRPCPPPFYPLHSTHGTHEPPHAPVPAQPHPAPDRCRCR